MAHRFSVVIALGLSVILTACASQATTSHSRNAPTEFRKGDRIVVILESLKDCKEIGASDCNAPRESAYEEASLSRCLDLAVGSRIPGSIFIPASAFREKVFPSQDFEHSPRSQDEILALVSDDAAKTKIEDLGIRYIVLLRVSRSVTPKTAPITEIKADAGMIVKKEWFRSTSSQAVVIDVAGARKSGTVSLSNIEHFTSGTKWVLFIIPTPYGEGPSFRQSDTCQPLGLALADFLQGKN